MVILVRPSECVSFSLPLAILTLKLEAECDKLAAVSSHVHPSQADGDRCAYAVGHSQVNPRFPCCKAINQAQLDSLAASRWQREKSARFKFLYHSHWQPIQHHRQQLRSLDLFRPSHELFHVPIDPHKLALEKLGFW